jgi:hypothetical protein
MPIILLFDQFAPCENSAHLLQFRDIHKWSPAGDNAIPALAHFDGASADCDSCFAAATVAA